MTLEEMVLRNDTRAHYTDSEIKRYLHDGVYVYANYEDFRQSCLDGLCEEDEIPAMWDALDTATIDGKTYRYNVVL